MSAFGDDRAGLVHPGDNTAVQSAILGQSKLSDGMESNTKLKVTMILTCCADFPQIVPEYKRAVVFRLGRLLPAGARGPGK